MMETIHTDLLVIGSGPGGYVRAIRAGQLGIETAIVEAAELGSTCLNVGCIPSNALIHVADEYHKLVSFYNPDDVSSQLGISAASAPLHLKSAMNWKTAIVNRLNSGVGSLLGNNNVKILKGTARFRDGKTVIVNGPEGAFQVHCKNVVVATGSEPIDIPTLPFGDQIISSTGALELSEVPMSLAVVGGGYIGLELGTSFAKMASRVTIVENAARLLPQYDRQLSTPVARRLEHLGIEVMTRTKALSYTPDTSDLKVKNESGVADAIAAEKVLVTVGRRARLEGWGLVELSLTMEHGYVAIDKHCQTSMRGVYAIGDVTGAPMLAHRAMAQGELVARHLAGEIVSWDKRCIPSVCFTDPETKL